MNRVPEGYVPGSISAYLTGDDINNGMIGH